MSSLFDAPAHLLLLLASIAGGNEPAGHTASEPARAAVTEQGPYSFSETNWLSAVRQGFGGELLDHKRARIFATSNGRLYVPVVAEKMDILAGRQNPAEARAVAIGLAKFNLAGLRARLGREPGVKDLYAAHMLGLDLAASLAGLKAANPGAKALTALPDLAARYPESVVQKGAALTVADVYRRLPDTPVRGTARAGASQMAVLLRGPINDHVPHEEATKEAWLPAHAAVQSKPDAGRAPVSP